MQSLKLPSSHAQVPRASRPGLRHQGRRHSLLVTAAGSTYGNNFRVTTFGESHGGGVGCVVDGVPPRLQITQACDVRFATAVPKSLCLALHEE
jgi:hypothetical protein